MIYTTVNLTIDDYESTADHNIILYRGDKNVEVRFVLVNNKFIVKDYTYAQLIIKRPSAPSIFSEVSSVTDNTVVLVITEEMIDELGEIGEYSFQIRLYDDNMNARVTLPPCVSGLIINEPLVIENESLINRARINYSVIRAYSGEEDTEGLFDEDGNYIKTEWSDGDIITDVKMNKIESALYEINANGGGGGAGSSPYISSTLSENVTVETGQDFDLYLDFSSPNLGKGTLKVFINDVDSLSTSIPQGENTVTISSSLLTKGTNKMVIYVLDRTGAMSNSLTFYIRYGSTELISTFDPYTAYDYGAVVRYYFTPTALDTSLALTFYMEIDGVTQEGVACVSDVRSYYTFPSNLDVGNHYCRAWVNDGSTNSNILTFNLIILDESSLVVASDTLNPSVEEGAQLVLDYKVYMKNNTSFITKTYIDETLVNTGTCTLETAYFRTSSLTEGTHTVKVVVFDITETYSDYVIWTVNVTPSTYEMKQPINAGSLFIASALNKTNSDENKEVWVGKNQDGEDVTATLTNFAFNSESGWVDDSLIISGNSWVEVPVAPLANNAKYGFTLDIEFLTKPIGVEDAEVLTLWNEEDNCGIKITTEQLIMRSKSGNQCDLYFSEDELVSAMFVIDRDEKTAKIYLNGVMCEAFALSDYVAAGESYLEDFTVNSNIYLGGYEKNGYSVIKNLRVYEVALATDEIMNNFISNEMDKTTQRLLVEFQKGDTLPTLTVYCDFSGLGKDDKKYCDIVYNSPDVVKYGESFALYGKYSQLQYQGTSSMQYPIKNYRLNPRDENGKVKLDPFNNGVPESRFTLKADFMSSGHWQNTGLAKWINDNLYNYNTSDESSMNARKWYDIQNGGSLDDTRESINGFPCRLILVNDGETPLNEGQQEPTPGNTKDMGIFNFNNDKDNTDTLGFDTDIFPNCMSFEVTANSDTSAGAFVPYDSETNTDMSELEYLQNSFELRFPDADDYGDDYGFLNVNGDTSMGLKRVIDWVGNATDEQFVEEFDQYFHRDYTLRYYLLVITLGMVDNLGKNMMFDTFDGKIWLPRFYDMDTICSYNNSGEITFDVDIEMEQGYWNTSASRLWTKIRDLMHDELVEKYNNMRQNGMSYESFMSYFYDKQIAQIPQTYYNKDYDVKYAPYADEYMGKAHGDGYEHLKRWLKRRLIFTDTLFDYAPSYTNDALTIRANTLDLMSLEIETYTPVYQHVSFYNGNMEKIKIDGKTSTIFEGTAQTATDQEVLIYGGSNIKRIKGISSMNPNSMLIGNATRLVELDLANCPILTVVNSNKANFSPHEYLNKLDISGCSQLGGTLRLNNSPLIQEINAKGTIIDNLLLPTSIRNLTTLKIPSTVTALALNDASLLSTLEIDSADNALQSVSMTNCNALTDVINFDLTQVPTVSLDNSYNAEELYMSKTTNLSLKNMSELERLIYIPNNEYDTFLLDTLKSSGDYKVDTFNCPKLTDFITTAPHRLSYNNSDVEVTEEIFSSGEEIELLDGTYTMGSYWSTSNGGWQAGTSFYHYIINTIEVVTTYHIKTSTSLTTSQYVRCTAFDSEGNFVSNEIIQGSGAIIDQDVTFDEDVAKVYFVCDNSYMQSCTYTITESITIINKDYGDIKPDTVFTANSLDLSDTQFTNIKFLCTTDLYKLLLPTTVKNFYCDSSFDIDTEVIEEAEYDIIHNELIEQYTTDYTEEVHYKKSTKSFIPDVIAGIALDTSTGAEYEATNGDTTDWIEVAGGTNFTWKQPYTLYGLFYIMEFDKDKNYIKNTKDQGSWIGMNPKIITLTDTTCYVRVTYTEGMKDSAGNKAYICTATTESWLIPNIIPSSSDGSLIFSMYAPKLVDEPSPLVWDLYGLELNDFHTFGMNNDVKPSDDSYLKIYNGGKINYKYSGYNGSVGETLGEWLLGGLVALPPIKVSVGDSITMTPTFGEKICWGIVLTDDNDTILKANPGYLYNGTQTITTEGVTRAYIHLVYFMSGQPSTTEVQVNINGVILTYDTTDTALSHDEIITLEPIDLTDYHMELGEVTSITMPVRYAPYKVQIQNANITPINYNTMLYPKLVDTTLPITGHLDYSQYTGSYLSWAFAYTTSDVTITPLGSQEMDNIKYDYNKLYSTDYVDVTDVWVYADTDVSTFSTNEDITEAYIELTSSNYTTRIDEVLQYYPNCADLYFFEDGSITSLQEFMYIAPANVDTDVKMQTEKVTFMEGYFENLTSLRRAFIHCHNLKEVVNIPDSVENMEYTFEQAWALQTFNLPTNLTTLYYAFLSAGIKKCPTIPESVTNIRSAFKNCSSLTVAPEIPNGVVSLESTFEGCTSLTEAPTIPESVTNMYKTFRDCSTLTNIPNIPDGVTSMDMEQVFYGCSALTSVPTIPEGVTSLRQVFFNCSSLTNIPNIPSGVTSLYNTFSGCSSLTSLPPIPSKVITMYEAFLNCSSLTEIDLSNVTLPQLSVTNLFRGCTKLTNIIGIENLDTSEITVMHGVFEDCTSLVSLDLTGWDVSNMTRISAPGGYSYGGTFEGCSSLETLDISTWDMSNVTGISRMYWDCSKLTNVRIPVNASEYWGALYSCSALSDVEWVGERTSGDFDVSSTNMLVNANTAKFTETDIHELMEHLGTVESATLTLGETYLAYLTEDEIAAATEKGWVLE